MESIGRNVYQLHWGPGGPKAAIEKKRISKIRLACSFLRNIGPRGPRGPGGPGVQGPPWGSQKNLMI